MTFLIAIDKYHSAILISLQVKPVTTVSFKSTNVIQLYIYALNKDCSSVNQFAGLNPTLRYIYDLKLNSWRQWLN